MFCRVKSLLMWELNKNKGEIPPSFLPFLGKNDVDTSSYGYTSNMTLSYTPKKNKDVLLISSIHHNQCRDPETGKSEIINYYNERLIVWIKNVAFTLLVAELVAGPWLYF